jgi:cation transport regulator
LRKCWTASGKAVGAALSQQAKRAGQKQARGMTSRNLLGRLAFLGKARMTVRSNPMPYKTNTELPDSVKNHLPSHAQDIYREAFDHAWSEYAAPAKRRGNESREEVAHKVAWAAVKSTYEKVGDEWRPKG